VAALGYVLNEVTHLHALQRVSLRDLKGASPMTMEYVRTTLGQDDAALFEENPEAVSAAANFLTASSGGDRPSPQPAGARQGVVADAARVEGEAGQLRLPAARTLMCAPGCRAATDVRGA